MFGTTIPNLIWENKSNVKMSKNKFKVCFIKKRGVYTGSSSLKWIRYDNDIRNRFGVTQPVGDAVWRCVWRFFTPFDSESSVLPAVSFRKTCLHKPPVIDRNGWGSEGRSFFTFHYECLLVKCIYFICLNRK